MLPETGEYNIVEIPMEYLCIARKIKKKKINEFLLNERTP